MTSVRKFKNLSHWLLVGEYYLLITSELTNQSAQKVLLTCVVYTNFVYSQHLSTQLRAGINIVGRNKILTMLIR